MTIPDYPKITLPLLHCLNDGQEHSMSDLVQSISTAFILTLEEREQMLASGRSTVIYSRVAWAVTYLRQAGLIESPKRGVYRLSATGAELLRHPPDRIDDKYLARYPSFQAFLARSKSGLKSKPLAISNETQTPEESMEATSGLLREQVLEDLLDKVKSCSPAFFERLVVDLLIAMGYGGSRSDAGKSVGRSGDEGIDGVINEDKLGLDVVYIQAKRWEGVVGRPIVQGFAGSLEGARARKGVFITTSSFSREAREYVGRIEKSIVLVDGRRLAELMLDNGVGITVAHTFDVHRLDLDYFEES